MIIKMRRKGQGFVQSNTLWIILGIIILVLVYLGIFQQQFVAKVFPLIQLVFPNFGSDNQTITPIQILRYTIPSVKGDIGDVQYYDGLKWQSFVISNNGLVVNYPDKVFHYTEVRTAVWKSYFAASRDFEDIVLPGKMDVKLIRTSFYLDPTSIKVNVAVPKAGVDGVLYLNNVRIGEYVLSPQDDSLNFYQDVGTKFDRSKVAGSENVILTGMIEWRDNVLKAPINLLYYSLKDGKLTATSGYFCASKMAKSPYILMDLTQLQDVGTKCF